jgi:exosome complex component RRP42
MFNIHNKLLDVKLSTFFLNRSGTTRNYPRYQVKMVLSIAESTYIYDSLVSSNRTRPDARTPIQYRPLKANCGFLPNSNGSSRIYNADGIECISSVKSKVVRSPKILDLVNVEIDIFGEKDNSTLCQHLTTLIKQSLNSSFDFSILKLTDKYYFSLYIDISILYLPEDFSSSSYTLYSLLSLISMGIYLALKSAKLPLLVSDKDDFDIEEEPTFSDDWEVSKYLIPRDSNNFQPGLIFIVGTAGETVIIDPSLEEEQILEHGICITWANSKITTPVQSLALSTTNTKGLKPNLIVKSMELVRTVANDVIDALDAISGQDIDEFDTIF